MQSTGVTVTLGVVVLVAAFFASSPVQCDHGIPTDYMHLPREGNYDRRELYNQVIVTDGRPAGLAPEKMLEEFKELSQSSPSSYVRDFSKHMYDLSVQGPAACNTETHRYVYEIISLSEQYPELPALANYINFIKTFGKTKFVECAAEVAQIFNLRMATGGMSNLKEFQSYERGLDSLVVAYTNTEQTKLDDARLYELAKRVDLRHGDYNVGAMLEIAKGFLPEGYLDTKPENLIILKYFMRLGAVILERIATPLGNYNIAVALGSQLPGDVPVRFLKLNEYYRIILSYDEAEENLWRQSEAVASVYESAASTETAPRKWYHFGRN